MPRSVCIHADRRADVALALQRNGFLTQGDLAAHLEIALSTVSNFCRGVKVSVAKYEQLCETLGLDKQAMLRATVSESASAQSNEGVKPQAVGLSSMPLLAYDDGWVGRQSELKDLVQRVEAGCRLVVLAGLSGIGKTALAERLAMSLSEGWLARTGAGQTVRVVRHNFDDGDRAGDFASVSISLLEQMGQTIELHERQDAGLLLQRLKACLQVERWLVVLDSLELVLKGDEVEGWSQFEDELYLQFVREIVAATDCQSCIVLTTQEVPDGLVEAVARYSQRWWCLPLGGLDEIERLVLFERAGLRVDSQGEHRVLLGRIGSAYEGHPLALRVIAGEIGGKPFFGHVRAYWDRYGNEIEEVERAIALAKSGQVSGAGDRWRLDRFSRALYRQVRSRLMVTFERLRQDAELSYLLLCESSVYRCAVPEDWWLSHLEYWQDDGECQELALDLLRERFLVEEVVEGDRYLIRQHNLVRSISLDCLRRLDEENEGMGVAGGSGNG